MKSQPANTETWRRRATRLLRHCDVDDYFRIDDRGVWPAEPWDTIGDDGELKLGAWRSSPDGKTGDVFGQWRPARVLAAKGYDIDPADTPALPFPFDAKELAAFMVNGMGAFVAEWYCDGDWDNGLSIEVLERSLPVDEVWLRQTVREAVDAYRTAKDAIGCPDGEHPDPDEIVWQLLKPDDASAAPPTGQQDAPERSSSEEDSGESRAGEVHPDALAKAIATEVVQQLRNPTDAPAAPIGTQQDAPKSNGDVDQTDWDAEAAYRQKRRDLLTPVIEKAQRQSGNKYDAASVWNELVKMAQAQESPLKGVTEDGIQWSDGNDELKYLSLKNLRDRIKRKKKQKTEAERATTR